MGDRSSRARRRAATGFTAVLALFTTFVLLDTFVVAHPYAIVAQPEETDPSGQGRVAPAASMCGVAPQSAPTTHTDPSRAVVVSSYRVDGTNVYVADVVLSDPAALKTAFASQTYGRNVTETTSRIAAANDALLAVNGDFYGARSSGYVVRGGEVYRDRASSKDQEDLAVMRDGTWRIVREGDASAAELVAEGAVDVFSFGPGLVADSRTVVDAGAEVDRAQASNPRTAIAWEGESHYLFVVADGRTSASAGLSLSQLGDFLVGCGAATAYNLDGGGSTTMWFQGQVVNHPTDGRSQGERKVSDIVYI